MDYPYIVNTSANILYKYDQEKPVFKGYKLGIGPFGGPQIVKVIADRLSNLNILTTTRRTPDPEIGSESASEFYGLSMLHRLGQMQH